MSRRFFLASTALMSVGCAMRRSTDMGTGSPTPSVRQPVVGQTWRYSQHDLYTHALVNNQVDRVDSIDRTIEINSNTEAVKDDNGGNSGWGTDFLRKYIDHRDKAAAGPLPSEIQGRWGMCWLIRRGAKSRSMRRRSRCGPCNCGPAGRVTSLPSTRHRRIRCVALGADHESACLGDDQRARRPIQGD